MTYWLALEILGVEDDDGLTRGQLRRIYLRKLKDHPPERDPEGFQQLREAFELVRDHVDDGPEADAPVAPAVFQVNEASGASDAPVTIATSSIATAPPPAFMPLVMTAMPALPPDERPPLPPLAPMERPPLPPLAPLPPRASTDGPPSPLAPLPPRASTDAPPPNTAPPIVAPPNTAPPIIVAPPNTAPPIIVAPPYTAPPIIIAPPAPPPSTTELPPLSILKEPEPPVPLAVLVPKLLELLESGHVETALELEHDWRVAGDSDDFRQADPSVVVRWSLLRELLGVAGKLRIPVTQILARGLAANDLRSIRPALEQYRLANPPRGEAANILIAKHAPTIYRQIEGTLYVPRPVVPPQAPLYIPDPPRSNGGGRGALGGVGVFAVIGMAIVRFMASSTSHSSYDSYDKYHLDDIKNIKIPDYNFRDIPYIPPATPSWFPPPHPVAFTDRTPETVWAQLIESAQTLQMTGLTSTEQVAAAATLTVDLTAENCRRARKALKLLDAAPPIEIAERKYYADEHIAAIHTGLDIVCPVGKKKKAP